VYTEKELKELKLKELNGGRRGRDRMVLDL
jgi:hypothetical protein